MFQERNHNFFKVIDALTIDSDKARSPSWPNQFDRDQTK